MRNSAVCTPKWPLPTAVDFPVFFKSNARLRPRPHSAQICKAVESGSAGLPGVRYKDDLILEGEGKEVASVLEVQILQGVPRYELPVLTGGSRRVHQAAFAVQHASGGYLVTTATGVQYSQQVRVRCAGGEKWLKARVVALSMDCDIALLKTDQKEMPDGVEMLELASRHQVSQEIQVLSPGSHGQRSSQGQISCLHLSTYPSSFFTLTALEVNVPGHMCHLGAPVVDAHLGTCLGMVFRKLKGSHPKRPGSALCIPSELIVRVIEGQVKDKHSKIVRLPTLGVRCRTVQSGPLQRYLGLEESQQGLLVLAVNPASSSSGMVQPGDVITHVDGMAVNAEGKLAGPSSVESTPLAYYVALQQLTVKVSLLREGRLGVHTIPLSAPRPLMPIHLDGVEPSYVVLGGLVLCQASVPLLKAEYGPAWIKMAPPHLVKYLTGFPSYLGEEVVVVVHDEGLPSTKGYEEGSYTYHRVVAFNGEAVKNLPHLAMLVKGNKAQEMSLDFEGGYQVVLDAAQVQRDSAVMCREYELRSTLSEDLEGGRSSKRKVQKFAR